jgi:hypothetical protein
VGGLKRPSERALGAVPGHLDRFFLGNCPAYGVKRLIGIGGFEMAVGHGMGHRLKISHQKRGMSGNGT